MAVGGDERTALSNVPCERSPRADIEGREAGTKKKRERRVLVDSALLFSYLERASHGEAKYGQVKT